MTNYSTKLTDKQLQVIKDFLNDKEHKRKYDLREIMNAIFYINKTGSHWRLLPKDFTPWQTVYFYFRKWKLEGVFEQIMESPHGLCRKIAGKHISPSLEIIDARSVKTTHHVDDSRGIDGYKKINERKEDIVVYKLGLPMAVEIHSANILDRKGDCILFDSMRGKYPRLSKIIADGGCRGQLAHWVQQKFGWVVEVLLRQNESPSKFNVSS